LTWPQNSRYYNRIKSAVLSHQRPVAALLFEPDPHNDWTPLDYQLQEAYHTLEQDKCKTCGNVTWLCHSPHSGIEFDIREGACFADAELKDYEKNHPESEKLESGVYRYAIAVGIKNEDGTHERLPSRAEALLALRTQTETNTD
jgi:hypothetical protein